MEDVPAELRDQNDYLPRDLPSWLRSRLKDSPFVALTGVLAPE